MPNKKTAAAALLGRAGGKARAANLTKQERSEAARLAGKARMAGLSEKQRKELAKKAVAAREAKRRKQGR